MDRRKFLQWAGVGMIGALAGCQEGTDQDTSSPTPTPSPIDTQTATDNTPSDSQTETRTTPEENTYFVSTDGDDGNDGTQDSPLATIQEGFNRAEPGESIHVLPGLHRVQDKFVETRRSGNEDNPITLTGPSDAVLTNPKTGPTGPPLLKIRHSHIHITGVTFDGLGPDDPDVRTSYPGNAIDCNGDADGYIRGLKLKPHAIGNVLTSAIHLMLVKDTEIGEFKMIGPVGVNYIRFDDPYPIGEVVYVGTSLGNLQDDWYPRDSVDKTSGIHIHHIDNSDGHGHSELVNSKAGTYDVLIEYCTDAGGAQPSDVGKDMGAISVNGKESEVRWCVASNHDVNGIRVGGVHSTSPENPPPGAADAATENAIYGNRLMDNARKAIAFPYTEYGQGPDDQKVICGNEYNGRTDGDPDKTCPADITVGDDIGHLGGDSPWT